MSITLTPRTLSILQNFSGVCPSIVLQPGKKLRVVSDSATVIAMADIEEDFPSEFPVLDITKLLAILKLKSFKECKLEFTDKKITLNGDKVELAFWASAKELTAPPPEDLILDDVNFQAEVTADTLDEFIRVCNVLSHKTAKLVNKNGKTYLTGTTAELENSNDYVVELGETTLGDCSFPLDVSNLKMMSSGYIIKACEEMQVASFESSDASLKYFVGLQLE
ncbi:sliding clamp DNA polymerase accessory protein [Erwinia phage vB_EamM-Bue1]|uniref:Sliding clamp n=1 Tax=Erwinia phage vB_EamM-Bue1 TaxID=2099338 RepID=A0A2P1JUA8_9CAUD|nr:sliding clamp DNA polymerase accessory protein [Erwinia phage vB_EamM-Bue1]AVO22950.1 sliding clamp DNA polymerase accessory protein [Erwinia phage vB_EamM-Bue1]